jgi:hypothetical protein
MNGDSRDDSPADGRESAALLVVGLKKAVR